MVSSRAVSPVWQASAVLAAPGSTAVSVAEGGEAADVEAAPVVSPTGLGELLWSGPVLTELMNQLDQRDVRLASDAAGLRAVLEPAVQLGGAPGAVSITYRTTDQAQAEPVVEAIARSLMGYQMAQDRRAGQAPSVRIDRPAALHGEPVQDDRLKVAAVIWGFGLVGVVLMGSLLRLLLGRAPRVLDGEGESEPALSVLDKPETWSPLPKAQG
jgi:hypothetical protein